MIESDSPIFNEALETCFSVAGSQFLKSSHRGITDRYSNTMLACRAPPTYTDATYVLAHDILFQHPKQMFGATQTSLSWGLFPDLRMARRGNGMSVSSFPDLSVATRDTGMSVASLCSFPEPQCG